MANIGEIKVSSMAEFGAEMSSAFKTALKENYQAAGRIFKRSTGMVGLIPVAKQSYEKDGSLRNAAKAVTNELIDRTADNLKDIYGICINSPALKAGEVVAKRVKTNLNAVHNYFK